MNTTDLNADPKFNVVFKWQKMADIIPQGSYEMPIEDFTTPPFHDVIVAGSRRLIYYGKLEYRDVYKGSLTHLTEFCVVYSSEFNEMTLCPHGNHMY